MKKPIPSLLATISERHMVLQEYAPGLARLLG